MASYTLVIQYVDRPAETRQVDAVRIVVGRDSGDIALRDQEVSGRHGELVFEAGKVMYRDLGSTNGSFRSDGQRIFTPVEMQPGQPIRLGHSWLNVQAIDAPEAEKGRTVMANPAMMAPRPQTRPSGSGPPPAPRAVAPAPRVSEPSAAAVAAPMPATRGGSVSAVLPAPPGMRKPAGAAAVASQSQAGAKLPAPMGMPPAPDPYGNPGAAPGYPPPGYPPPGYPPPGYPPSGHPHGHVGPAAVHPPGYAPHATPYPPNAYGHVQQVVQGIETGAARVGTAIQTATQQTITGEQIRRIFERTLRVYAPHVGQAAMVLGMISVPAAVVSFVLAFVPIVGWALAILVNLAAAVASVVGMGAVTRFVINLHLGRPMTAVEAWKATLPRAVPIGLDFFVAGLVAGVGVFFLIIPGIALGCFIGQVQHLEDKKLVEINIRNLDLFKHDWLRITVMFLLVGLGVAIPLFVLSAVVGWIPLVGLLFTSVLHAAIVAVVTPFMLEMSTLLYFDLRRQLEGGDPEAAAREKLAISPGSEPSA